MTFYNNGVDWVNDAFPGCKFTQVVSWCCYAHDANCLGANFIAEEIKRRCRVDAFIAAGMAYSSCDCSHEGLICLRDDHACVSFGYDMEEDKIDYYFDHDYVQDYDALMACLPGIYRRFIDLYTRAG